MMRGSMMTLGTRKKLLWLAFVFAMPAIFLSATSITAQKTVRDLPPPPAPWKAKPKPTPKPEPEVIDVVKVTSNLVMVPVSVTDNQGQAVQGLQIPDFRLEEEGKQQEIAEIGDPEQVPLAIAILFDISSSVSQKGFFVFQQNAAAAFLRQVMKPIDKAAVFTIAGKPNLVQPLASAATAAAKVVSIPAATSSVPTAFYDSVIAAAKYLAENSPSRNRRVIVVISDGDDNFSERIREFSVAEARANMRGEVTPSAALVAAQDRHRRAVADVQQAVLKADATFYSVNPGGASVKLNQISMRAQAGMSTVAEATGGTAFVPEADKDLEAVFRRVAAELRGQYLLQYYASSDIPSGQFRRIAVAVPTRQVRVRARQGYYAKKQ